LAGDSLYNSAYHPAVMRAGSRWSAAVSAPLSLIGELGLDSVECRIGGILVTDQVEVGSRDAGIVLGQFQDHLVSLYD
jgi:hypothetical protein